MDDPTIDLSCYGWDAIDAAVLIIDSPSSNARILYANTGCQSLSGYGVNELVGQQLDRLFDANLLLQVVTANDSSAIAATAIELRRKHGTPLSCRASVAVQRDTGGAVCGSVVTLVDVSKDTAFDTSLASDAHLPSNPVPTTKPERTLLLVDDEGNILSALKRLLRHDGYRIFTAGSGAEGLDVLDKNRVDVIVSDQRMPGMTGVEFLGLAKNRWPDTVRLVLSGYTELQSVTDAVNEGAIYKFLTKPWDDQKLSGHIQEAFQRKEMSDENKRLSHQLSIANHDLAEANRRLQELVDIKQQQIVRDTASLDIMRDALQQIPFAVIAFDDAHMIAFAINAAMSLLQQRGELLGAYVSELLPELQPFVEKTAAPCGQLGSVLIDGRQMSISVNPMGRYSTSIGYLVTLIPADSRDCLP